MKQYINPDAMCGDCGSRNLVIDPEVADDTGRTLARNKGRDCDYCPSPATRRGLCTMHYKRLKRRGLLGKQVMVR